MLRLDCVWARNEAIVSLRTKSFQGKSRVFWDFGFQTNFGGAKQAKASIATHKSESNQNTQVSRTLV